LAAQSASGDNSKDTVSPLYSALDRFAQFFIEPLFLEDTLDRELRAVDSENKKNLQSDTWRLHQLSRSLANPNHPYHKFSTGNLQTLRDEPVARGVEIRKEFIKFHEDNYSANRMKLVVIGRESLNELQLWVEEMFSEVINKDLPQNRWDNIAPYTKTELMTQTFAKPVMDTRSLDIDFVTEDEELQYDTQPSHYISHLIGHEGPGSILAYLKEKGWANGLSAGGYDVCPGAGLFHISIKMTPEGLKHYKEITTTVFQYISILQETGPQQWVFEEMKGMSEVDFRFKQKSPVSRTTSGLSAAMQKPLPREWLLSGNVVRKFDAEAIRKTLSHLRPDNCRLTIVSQNLDEMKEGVSQEKWYGTEYKMEKLPKDFQEEIKKAASATAEQRPGGLHLPAKNEFIPTRLEVEKKEIAEPSKAPTLIRNEDNVRLWYKKDDQFWVPKANINIYLRNPVTKSSARNAAIAHLYAELVQDSLTEYSYDAEIAGLSYSLYAGSGILVDVGGYNDKMAVLLEKVLVSLRDLEIKKERFEIIKERTMRSYRNSELSSPYQQAGRYTAWLAKDKGYITDDYLAEFPSIGVEDLRFFKSVLLSQLHIEGLAHGNIYREDALKLIDLTQKILKPKNLPVTQWPIRRSLMLPEGSNYVYSRTLKDPSNVNHCIEYICQVGLMQDRRLYNQLRLFSQMTDEPAFDQLRSKEQLGYIVFRGITQQETSMSFRILVQSERTCEYLEQRIDSFLTKFKETLTNMTKDEFESHRRSVINKRLEKLKNLDGETGRYVLGLLMCLRMSLSNVFIASGTILPPKCTTSSRSTTMYLTYVPLPKKILWLSTTDILTPPRSPGPSCPCTWWRRRRPRKRMAMRRRSRRLRRHLRQSRSMTCILSRLP